MNAGFRTGLEALESAKAVTESILLKVIDHPNSAGSQSLQAADTNVVMYAICKGLRS
jgi:hypothetical protein